MADGDAERTRLANERTHLAWWRTGIAGIAAGFAVGRIVPEVWPYVAVGSALTATGVLAFVYGAVLVLAAIGVEAGIASILLVLIAP